MIKLIGKIKDLKGDTITHQDACNEIEEEDAESKTDNRPSDNDTSGTETHIKQLLQKSADVNNNSHDSDVNINNQTDETV